MRQPKFQFHLRSRAPACFLAVVEHRAEFVAVWALILLPGKPIQATGLMMAKHGKFPRNSTRVLAKYQSNQGRSGKSEYRKESHIDHVYISSCTWVPENKGKKTHTISKNTHSRLQASQYAFDQHLLYSPSLVDLWLWLHLITMIIQCRLTHRWPTPFHLKRPEAECAFFSFIGRLIKGKLRTSGSLHGAPWGRICDISQGFPFPLAQRLG